MTARRRAQSTAEAGLLIHAANRLETLLDALATAIRSDPLGPLEREVIVVQSRGMYRWVTLEFARKLGIAATIATPFPGTFCEALAERVEGASTAAPSERYEPAPGSAHERDALAWRIFGLLGATGGDVASFAAAYLAGDQEQHKRHQLAVRLAERFDEYMLYRPDVLLAWEDARQPIGGFYGDTARWQAALWRAIVASAGRAHPARRLLELVDRLRQGKALQGLPPRVTVFGASSLPPVFLDVLGALALHVPVSIFTVSPTDEYWGHIRPPRTVAAQLDLFRERGLAEEYAHAETGNPLLASLGLQGRELHELLVRLDENGSAWRDLDYTIPLRDTVLGALQADVVELVDRMPVAPCGSHTSTARGPLAAARAPEPALAMPRGDRSLEIHVCHSPMREMEVLRDLLLDAFASDPSLRPHDVFVLAPDISRYAPYIETVFGAEHAGEPAIPFTIADRSPRYEQSVIDAGLRILELVDARVTASAVVDLLDAPAVRRAARIAPGDVETVREWVRTTHVRWGIDEQHRSALVGVRSDGADTWRAGLDRMLMGYAMGPGDTSVGGIVPAAEAGSDAALLGRFVAFAGTLFEHLRSLGAARSLDAWAHDLRLAFDDLIDVRDEVEEKAAASLREAVERLRDLGARTGLRENVELAVVRDAVAAALDRAGGGAGFMTGGVTFCSLQPMRAIPAKIMCVAGLDAGAFPRRDWRASFDLMAAEHRLGDRSPRDDDRYLFLETLLAARERLILLYVGRSQRDNAELPPASVLSELLDTIDHSFAMPSEDAGANDATPAHERETPSGSITVIHPLQAFSERYFEPGSPLFSYSRVNRAAAERARAGAAAARPFVGGALDAEGGVREIALADLVDFWVNPSRFFCRNVLGLRLPRDEDDLEESEPFSLDSLASYQVGDEMTRRRLHGAPAGDAELALFRARGELPHAGFAAASYERVRTEIDSFTAAVTAASGGALTADAPIAIDLVLGDWRLTGTIEDTTPNGLLRYRPAKLKPKDYVRAWIPHVALTLQRARHARGNRRAAGCATLLVGKDETVCFGAVSAAEPVLQALLEGCAEGRRRPLPLFEYASRAYVEQQLKIERGEAEKSALACAREAFEGSDFGRGRVPGDREDAYVGLCTRDRDPIAEDEAEFVARSLALWGPIFASREGVPR